MKKGQLHPGVVAVVLIVVLGGAAGVIYKMTNTPITTGLEGGGAPSGGGKKDDGAKPKDVAELGEKAKGNEAENTEGKGDKTK